MVNFSGLQFHDRAPVYQQIAEYLKRQILLGTVQDGDAMPSRRELAAQTGINPNTAQKAYRLMTEEGYIYTDGNNGSVVRLTPQLQEAIDEGADCLVTGEAAHHIALLAKQKGVGLVVAGHWGTEQGIADVLAARLHTAFPQLEVRHATADTDPYTYLNV